MFWPEIAATTDGAPNIAAIPAATPIIKPQDTFPEKKPIPTAIMANEANVLPADPVTTLNALHIDLVNEFELVLAETSAIPGFNIKALILLQADMHLLLQSVSAAAVQLYDSLNLNPDTQLLIDCVFKSHILFVPDATAPPDAQISPAPVPQIEEEITVISPAKAL